MSSNNTNPAGNLCLFNSVDNNLKNQLGNPSNQRNEFEELTEELLGKEKTTNKVEGRNSAQIGIPDSLTESKDNAKKNGLGSSEAN